MARKAGEGVGDVNFDRASAIQAAKAADLAYRAPTVRAGSTAAFVEYDAPSGTLTLAIAGTDDMTDLLADLRAIPAPVGWKLGHGVSLHAGFVEQQERLHAALCRELKKYPPPSRIVAGGHSLGAAMMALTVARIPGYFLHAEVYLFGCPKIGDKEWADHFRVLTHGCAVFRVEGAQDWIPRFPMAPLWHHVGTWQDGGPVGHSLAGYIAALS